MKKKTTFASVRFFNLRWINKYTLTTIVFVGWLLFFDKYNFFAQAKLNKTTAKLEQEYAQLKIDIEDAKKEKYDLESNQEKYGREKYYLHKNNEDVFIIEKN